MFNIGTVDGSTKATHKTHLLLAKLNKDFTLTTHDFESSEDWLSSENVSVEDVYNLKQLGVKFENKTALSIDSTLVKSSKEFKKVYTRLKLAGNPYTIYAVPCFMYDGYVSIAIYLSTVNDKKIRDLSKIPNIVSAISMGAFTKCDELRNIIVPDNITALSDFSFSYCSNLETIILHSGIVNIGIENIKSCVLS